MSQPALEVALFHPQGTPLGSLPGLVIRTCCAASYEDLYTVSFVVTVCSAYRSSRAHDATVEGCMRNNKAYRM
jgi:hypothetical protein